MLLGISLLWQSIQAQLASNTYPGEKHLKNVRQITSGGDNAEAYWSHNDRSLVFQRTHPATGALCDQIFFGEVDQILRSEEVNQTANFRYTELSAGKGRNTCSYFLPGDSLVVYAGTRHWADSCTPAPPRVKGKYYWSVHEAYELYLADLKGNIRKRLTDNAFYDAEAVVSPKGDKILFTSDRSGDLELWTMNLDGSGLKQITFNEGYDGGAFFSGDGERIVWRASHFDSDDERAAYREDLKKHLVSPNKMELYTAKADGSERKQITHLGGANWAPFFHPSGKKIIFSSNHKTRSIPFNLYMVNLDGSGLEQISFDPVFDSFPMFSHDGKHLVFGSNRNNGGTRDTNVFIADWVE